MEDFLIIEKWLREEWSYAHVRGAVNDQTVHIHVTEDCYHLYDGTELTNTTQTIIDYLQLVLKRIVREKE